jgi:dihydropteroate synthase
MSVEAQPRPKPPAGGKEERLMRSLAKVFAASLAAACASSATAQVPAEREPLAQAVLSNLADEAARCGAYFTIVAQCLAETPTEQSQELRQGYEEAAEGALVRAFSYAQIAAIAEKALKEGAAILDVGGYSSRPGAKDISEEEELNRVVNGIFSIHKEFPEAFISVDTFRSRVAKESVGAGAGIINDISGGTLDEQMFGTVANLQVPYILMHTRGTPQTMASNNKYENLLHEVLDFLQVRINKLIDLRVNDIIIDPGFGFAKSISQNYEILKNLEYFAILNMPLLNPKLFPQTSFLNNS